MPEIKRQLGIIHQMGRSGGTLISRCLGCMDGVLLLSEVHPENQVMMDPLSQAQRWFGLFDEKHCQSLKDDPSIGFIESIQLIQTACQDKGEKLVLRDWSHWDFLGLPFHSDPSFQLRTAEALAPHFHLRRVATVRHPIDQWLSTEKISIMRGKLDLDTFLHGCRAFAEACAPLGFVRYEDFTRDPDLHLQSLCEALGLDFDAGYRERWSSYRTISGDVGSGEPGQSIRVSRRAAHDDELLDRFAQHPDYQATLDLLGYGHPF